MRTISKRASALFQFPTAREFVRNASCCSHKRIDNVGLKNHKQFYSATLLTSGLKLLLSETLITNSTTIANSASKQLNFVYDESIFYNPCSRVLLFFNDTHLKTRVVKTMQLPIFANIITSSRNGIL